MTKAKLSKLEKLRAKYEKLNAEADDLCDTRTAYDDKVRAAWDGPSSLVVKHMRDLKTVKLIAKYGPLIVAVNKKLDKVEAEIDALREEIQDVEYALTPTEEEG